MISAGYKSAYQQGYSDAMRDFRKEPNIVSVDEAIKTLKETYVVCVLMVHKTWSLVTLEAVIIEMRLKLLKKVCIC